MSNKGSQTVWNKHRNLLCFLHSEGLGYFSGRWTTVAVLKVKVIPTVDHDYGLLISITGPYIAMRMRTVTILKFQGG